MAEYRHQLPSREREKWTFNPAREPHERARQLGLRTGRSLNELYSRALARQLQGWIESEVECVDPLTGRSYIKEAGKKFVERTGRFPTQIPGAHGADEETVESTIRLDPLLLADWQDGVWQQLQRYAYPSIAASEALRAYLDAPDED